jgi:hypothetical protein
MTTPLLATFKPECEIQLKRRSWSMMTLGIGLSWKTRLVTRKKRRKLGINTIRGTNTMIGKKIKKINKNK